jgi:hypothetical protein
MERYRGRRKKGYRRMDDKYLQNLVNDTVIRITKKMTGVSMQAAEAPANRSRHNPVLKILITDGGRGQVTALYSTSNRAFHKIADGMKGRPVEDEAEMVVYIKEYFNVLCGNIISRINREKRHPFGLEFRHTMNRVLKRVRIRLLKWSMIWTAEGYVSAG